MLELAAGDMVALQQQAAEADHVGHCACVWCAPVLRGHGLGPPSPCHAPFLWPTARQAVHARRAMSSASARSALMLGMCCLGMNW